MPEISPHSQTVFQALQNWAARRAPSAPAPQSPQLNPLPSLAQGDQLSRSAPVGSAGQANLGLDTRPLIGPEDRVLHIGDSHTVGIYGQTMDNLLRQTGAKVESYGSAGSSPRWWITGQSTRSGFFSKDSEGNKVQPHWRTPHPTPKFKDLAGRFQPNVVMISLGANLLNADGATIERQMRELAEQAKATGARIVWVGPPDGRESKKPTSKQNELYRHLERVAKDYGSFIDSRPLTEYPATGGDGVHYWGTEGSRIARQWANEVFQQIQALPE